MQPLRSKSAFNSLHPRQRGIAASVSSTSIFIAATSAIIWILSRGCRSRRSRAILIASTHICLISLSAGILVGCTSSPRRAADSTCAAYVAALDRFFGMVSARYDMILIDLPPTWFTWTPQIVSASDGVIVTGLNTIPALRQTVEMLAVVREAAHPGAQISVVINRCERRLVGGVARRRHVETVL